MTNVKKNTFIFGVTIIILFFIANSLHMSSSYITIDEVLWSERVNNFWAGIATRDFRSTYQTSKPGVTTMILAGIPREISEVFSISSYTDILAIQRFGIVIGVALNLLVMVFCLSRINTWWALFALIFITLEPFFLGLSRILHVDALLSMFMGNTLLLYIMYLTTKKKSYAILTALFLGMAILTKIPAFFLFGYLPLITLLYTYINQENREVVLWRFKKLVNIGVIALILYFVLWPVLWVDPLFFIVETIPRLSNVLFFPHGKSPEAVPQVGYNPLFYLETLTMFLTTKTQVLFVGAVASFALLPAIRTNKKAFFITASLLAYCVLFIIGMTLGSKKGERYILPAIVMMIVFYTYFLSMYLSLLKNKTLQTIFIAVVGAGIVMHIRTNSQLHPHYLAYYNRTTVSDTHDLKVGLGEGLELGANYLNQKENAQDLRVAAWYPGIFKKLFTGRVTGIERWEDDDIDYIVTYRNLLGRPDDHIGTIVMKELSVREPEKIIYINELPYVWIYKKN